MLIAASYCIDLTWELEHSILGAKALLFGVFWRLNKTVFILYSSLNQNKGGCCRRVYASWLEVAKCHHSCHYISLHFQMVAMTASSEELSGTFRKLKIDEIDKMQDEMLDLAGYRSEIQDSLGQSYSVPDHLDEELMGELTALEDDMVSEIHNDQMPAYLQPEKAHEFEAGVELPSAPFGHGPTTPQHTAQGVDEDDLPAASKASSIKT